MSIARPPPLFGLLAIAGFVSLVSTRICDAMLPALALAFGIDTTQASATISAYAIVYGLMQLVYGPLGDRYGKTRVILLASAWCALSTAVAASAPSLEALVLARAATALGAAAILPLSIAWVGDTVPFTQRQQILARYSGITVFGMILGPFVGGLLADALHWRAAFVLLALLFGVVALRLWPQARAQRGPPEPSANAASQGSYLQQLRTLLSDRWARCILAGGAVESALCIGLLALLPTVMHARFGLSLVRGGALLALFGLGGLLFSRSAAALLRRVTAPTLSAVAGVLLAAAFAMLAVMPHWGWAAAGCTLGGFGFFMLHNTLQAQATALSAGATGLTVSLFTGTMFIGQSVGISLGALALAHLAPGWLFAGAGLGLLLQGLSLARALRVRGFREARA